MEPGDDEEGGALIGATLARAPSAAPDPAAIRRAHDSGGARRGPDWHRSSRSTGSSRDVGQTDGHAERAIAAAMAHGPDAGLLMLEPLDTTRASPPLSPRRARAHFHEMVGGSRWRTRTTSRAARRRAPERDYLTTKAARVAETLRRPAPRSGGVSRGMRDNRALGA